MSEIVFPDGISFQAPRQGAPDFVKGGVGINVQQAMALLQENVDDRGWVNLDLKESKNGKWYLSKNTWKPQNQSAPASGQQADSGANASAGDINDEIPF